MSGEHAVRCRLGVVLTECSSIIKWYISSKGHCKVLFIFIHTQCISVSGGQAPTKGQVLATD